MEENFDDEISGGFSDCDKKFFEDIKDSKTTRQSYLDQASENSHCS